MLNRLNIRDFRQYLVIALQVVTLFCGLMVPAWAQTYNVTVLGTFGGPDSQALDINNSGQVVGWAYIDADDEGVYSQHAFRYSNGVMQDLGTLGGKSSSASAINDSGQVVGIAHTDGMGGVTAVAFLYNNGVMQNLGTLGGSSSRAFDINSSGQIVGWSTVVNAQGADDGTHAFLYSNGVMQDLGTLGGKNSQAKAISDSGQVVGWSEVANGDKHAFLYSGGVMQDLGILDNQIGAITEATSINDANKVVGHGNNAAFTYSNGVMENLLRETGGAAQTFDINNDNTVLGYAGVFGGGYTDFFLYRSGVMSRPYVDPAAGSIYPGEKAALNDSGQIAASILPPGAAGFRACILTPTAATNTDGSLSGRVIDHAGSGLAGVEIQVKMGSAVLAHTTTDNSGNYQFPKLHIGNYTLRAYKSGYVDHASPGITVVAAETTTYNLSLLPFENVGLLTATVTTPAASASLPALTQISGTASDDQGNEGINRVYVFLFRTVSSGEEYWTQENGVWAWRSMARSIPATVTPGSGSNVTWNLGATMPSGSNLPNRSYNVRALVYDAANNHVWSPTNSFTIDNPNPISAVVVSPGHNSAVNALSSIRGTAADNTTGSGITRVDIYLYRYVSGVLQSWRQNGGTWSWSNGSYAISTTITPPNNQNVTWNVSSNLPSGTDLPEGTYYVRAMAYNGANHTLLGPANTFTVDATNPLSVVVTTPANDSNVLNLNNISGTAADNPGGSGISRVDLYLYRYVNGALQTWRQNGGTWSWSSGSYAMPATVTPINGQNVTWSVNSNFPAGANLPRGIYYARAQAYDAAGNFVLGASNLFTLVVADSSSPVSALVTTPANNASVQRLDSISGTAADNAGGSGIDRVNIYLYRYVGGVLQSWRQSGAAGSWVNGSYAIPAAVVTAGGQNVTWSVNSNLPSGAELPPGTYYVRALAYDGGNNSVLGAPNVFTYVVDTSNPVSAVVTTPAHNSTIQTLGSISGTAADNAGGSGIHRADVYLYRYVESVLQSWRQSGGTGSWTNGSYPIPVTVEPVNGQSVTWSVSSNLPSGANLPAGVYYARVYAYDRENNALLGPANLFTVSVAGVTSKISPVRLKSVVASASQGSIKLVFDGALTSATAADEGNYAVTVNGKRIDIQKAVWDGRHCSVTLNLEGGAWSSAEEVIVGWRGLKDIAGRELPEDFQVAPAQ